MTAKHSTPKKSSDSIQLPGALTLFEPSWEAFKLNFWTFVTVFIAPIIVLLVPGFIAVYGIYMDSADYQLTHAKPQIVFNILAIAIGIVGVILMSFVLTAMMYVLKYQSAKGNKMSVKDVWQQTQPYWWRMFRLYVVRNLVIGIAFLLFIVPGLFMWRRYMLAPYYLLDKNTSVGEAMRQSAADSMRVSGAIWGMMGVYIIISLSGVIPLAGYVLGPIIGTVYCCAQALRYLQVKKALA